MTQPNAPDVWPIWRSSQPAATVSGAVSCAPQYVTRQPVDAAGNGAVLTLTTAKLTAGYVFFWNSQYNYKNTATAGTTITTWFSPRWFNGNTNQFVNYVCTDVINTSHVWSYTISTGTTDLNSGSTVGLTTQAASNSIVFQGQAQAATPDANGFYSTSCYGARAIYMTEAAYLAPLKVGNSFGFNSGFRRQNNGVEVARSSVVTSTPTFVIVDTASCNAGSGTQSSSSAQPVTYVTNGQPPPVDPWTALVLIANRASIPTTGWSQRNLQNFIGKNVDANIASDIGFVTAVSTIKTATGYGVAWNNQLNTKTALGVGAFSSLFAPKWNLASPSGFLGYSCQTDDGKTFKYGVQAYPRASNTSISKDLSSLETAKPTALVNVGCIGGPATCGTTGFSSQLGGSDLKNGWYSYFCAGSKLFTTVEPGVATLKYGDKFDWNALMIVPGVSASTTPAINKLVYQFDQDYRILDFSAANYLQIASAAVAVLLVAI